MLLLAPVDTEAALEIGQHALMAGDIETRLDELGLALPASPQLPPGVSISFEWVRVRGNRAFCSIRFAPLHLKA